MSIAERSTLFTPSHWTDVADGDVEIQFDGRPWVVTFRLLDLGQIEALLKRKQSWEGGDEVQEAMFLRIRAAWAVQAVDGTPLHEILPVIKNQDGVFTDNHYLRAKEEWSRGWKPPLLNALDEAYVEFATSFMQELEERENDPFTEPSRDEAGN